VAVPVPAGANNTFVNLFTFVRDALANALFGFRANQSAGAEFAYKGPYLAPDMATKSDPWGGAYLILGYNANGRRSEGPIWIVCAGSAGTIDPVNYTPVNGRYRETWDTTAPLSRTNIAIRVH
jgi:hypothetical protein